MRQPRSTGVALLFGAALLGCGSSEPSRPVLPAGLKFADQPAPVTTSGTSLGVVRVQVVTEDGQLVSGGTAWVTLSLVSSDTSAHLAGTTMTQSAYGVATFPDLRVGRAGHDFRLAAHVAGL